jgi:hypothetical protein
VFFAAPLKTGPAHPLQPALPAAYLPCNPSILRTADGYVVNVRAVSYRIDAYQRYSPTEPDRVLRTRNYLLRIDRDLGFLGQQEIEHSVPAVREHLVQGLEDCRLVAGPRGMAATCTTTQYHPAGAVRISWLELGEDRVERHVPLSGHGDQRVQKNWLPFVEANGELRAVYGFEPLVVLAIDPVTGRVEPVVERRQGRNFHHWRGSAGPVDLPAAVGGGRLLMVHEVAWQGRRYYLHRFVRVDADWTIDRVSEPFYFHQPGIEFACGMCLAHGDRELLVTYGVEDREAYLARLPLSDVMQSLRPLPD